MTHIFDDIRPFYDSEIESAMTRLMSSSALPYISQFVFPGKPIEYIKSIMKEIHSIDDFQLKLMYYGIKQIRDLSTTGLSHSGLTELPKDKAYLFISNHRDIALDPAFLQWCLIESGHRTSEISFGDNLLFDKTYEDIARSNKMFIVVRGGTMREMLSNSIHLSEYIREAVTCRNSSVWLAQRNGRTKDGFDATDQGIMKMLSLSASNTKSPIESFAELNIVPMSISYEYEPCDLFKAREVLIKNRDGAYIKSDGEDKCSVLTGITQQKGNVHISFGTPIGLDEISVYSDLHVNNLNHTLAELLDKKIYTNYKLMPTNFIAHDMLTGTNEFENNYSSDQKTKFEEHLNSLIDSEKEIDHTELREVLLGIYSKCVDNAIRYQK